MLIFVVDQILVAFTGLPARENVKAYASVSGRNPTGLYSDVLTAVRQVASGLSGKVG